jgi:hypothetical protein
MAGDRITISKNETKTVYYWYPLCDDGKTLDMNRTKRGLRRERYLHPRFFEILRIGNNLIALSTVEYITRVKEPSKKSDLQRQNKTVIPLINIKRKPLLRLPVWGLPPRWY